MKIREQIVEKISGAGPVIESALVDSFTNKEIDKRVSILVKALDSIDSKERELKKLDREDVVMYQGGQKILSTSKDRYEKVQKLKTNLEELIKISEEALKNNTEESFKKLNDFLSKDGGNKTEGSKESE